MDSSVDAGYLESAQRLVTASREWNQQALLDAAQRAVLRNTGWPIGLVLTKRELAPRPTPEGVEARITKQVTGVGEDFWYFRKDGSYYVSRTFEEDEPRQRIGGKRFLWFDVRIWRIAEVILHSAAIYRELGVPADEPYVLAINHHGLEGREFRSSDPLRLMLYDRLCGYPGVEWSREITQDYVAANLQSLVADVANGVFVLFDFATIDDGVMKKIVDDFLHRRV